MFGSLAALTAGVLAWELAACRGQGSGSATGLPTRGVAAALRPAGAVDHAQRLVRVAGLHAQHAGPVADLDVSLRLRVPARAVLGVGVECEGGRHPVLGVD